MSSRNKCGYEFCQLDSLALGMYSRMYTHEYIAVLRS